MPDRLILTKSEFARRHGRTESAVSKWLARARIFGPALTEDGRIDVAVAEKQLGITLDVSRSEGKLAAARSAETADSGKGAPVSTLREQILAVELEQKRRRLEAEKGVYVRADQVRAERGRALAEMIAAIDGWLGGLVGELGLDRDQAAQARASWRRFRERQADALIAEAQTLPELLADAA